MNPYSDGYNGHVARVRGCGMIQGALKRTWGGRDLLKRDQCGGHGKIASRHV
jgi:hypothetical protein